MCSSQLVAATILDLNKACCRNIHFHTLMRFLFDGAPILLASLSTNTRTPFRFMQPFSTIRSSVQRSSEFVRNFPVCMCTQLLHKLLFTITLLCKKRLLLHVVRGLLHNDCMLKLKQPLLLCEEGYENALSDCWHACFATNRKQKLI